MRERLGDIERAFVESGHSFFYVGGYVRDILRGVSSYDVDATTSARPEEIKALIGDKVDALYDVGQKYGTIAVKVNGVTLEITTYRGESYVEGSRKPEVVFGNNLLDDLARRDFTINAIAMDVMGNIIDPFNGRADLQWERIRSVGDPYARFNDDPLRMLRAVRFATAFRMLINDGTARAIKLCSHALSNISAERIRDELSKILLTDNPADGVSQLRNLGLLYHILPEVSRLVAIPQHGPYHGGKNVYAHTLDVVQNSEPRIEQRLAALLHDTGKWDTGDVIPFGAAVRSTFIGHEDFSETYARRALRRLRYDNETIRKVSKLVEMHMKPYNVAKNPERRTVRRFIRKVEEDGIITTDDLMDLNMADIKQRKDTMEHLHLRDMIEWVKTVEDNPATVDSPLDGNELMTLTGRGPGPWIKEAKDYLTQLVVDGELDEANKEKAKEIVSERYVGT